MHFLFLLLECQTLVKNVVVSSAVYCVQQGQCLTHCRLNELPHTIYWKILILIIGMSDYVI